MPKKAKAIFPRGNFYLNDGEKALVERVCYPFGYGLSYTTFALETVQAGTDDGQIQVEVQVTNTGKRAVVQQTDPWAIMSSYNIINGRRASESRELLTDILRGDLEICARRVLELILKIDS